MIQNEQRKELIKYRIGQAKDTAEEAEIMLKNDKLRGAVNRIYYSMFYMLLALALKHEFDTSKHGQLIGWFNKTFIKTGTIDRRFGRILREAFDFRQQGDYGTYTRITIKDVENKFELMNEFINNLEKFILQ